MSTYWSDKPEHIATELQNIVDTLSNYAYSLNDTQPITDSIQSILFSTCNHLERIVSDLENLDEIREPQRMTETVTTTKTLYL